MANQIMAIAPYWLDEIGTWVFDDTSTGLVREPFVSGVPELIDQLVVGIPNAKQGFRLVFSAAAFPGYQRKFFKVEEECGGYWYATEVPGQSGWLCPAMFRYFETAPDILYVKAEEIKSGS